MAGRYSQIFTMRDIFTNPNLLGRLPIIDYKETPKDNGKVSVRTKLQSVDKYVFDTTQFVANMFYKPARVYRSKGQIIVTGNLDGDTSQVVDAIYETLLASKDIMAWSGYHTELLRDALKESESNRRKYGIQTKLYLRCQSMQEIEGMTRKQLSQLLLNVFENIFYGDDFPKTRRKYFEEYFIARDGSFEQEQLNWKLRVGDV